MASSTSYLNCTNFVFYRPDDISCAYFASTIAKQDAMDEIINIATISSGTAVILK
jgi:hypothetical protein